jgi:hypothetical protein
MTHSPLIPRRAIGWLTAGLFTAILGPAADDAPAEAPAHPRLYLTAENLPALRAARGEGVRKRIWENIEQSAEECMAIEPTHEWIAPVTPDPNYENLYDRFYTMMRDMAVTEHLAFAYALSGDERYGDRARDWVLQTCRVWKNETTIPLNGGTAYAVNRFLKGAAVGYDLAHDRFSPAERDEVREVMTAIGQKYYTEYFSTPHISGPDFRTHHAIVEYGSFGVLALALLDEVPEARGWLDHTINKFKEHLLPKGLAADGAQVEGSTFWASTMQYRLFFMDALRRVTGEDLFEDYGKFLNADLALAAVAAEKHPGFNRVNETVVLEPSYGQLDYYSPVLLFLAREQRRPIFQHLALWDHALGLVQPSRYLTPTTKIPLWFAHGGYAYLWYDESVSLAGAAAPLSYHFPSINEAYIRRSWEPDDLLAGISAKRGLVLHAGGRPVLIEHRGRGWQQSLGELSIAAPQDDEKTTAIASTGDSGQSMRIEIDRAARRMVVRRHSDADWLWWCQGDQKRNGNSLRWSDGTTLKVTTGKIVSLDPVGYQSEIRVGLGKLPVFDPAKAKFPLATIHPDDGQIVIEVHPSSRDDLRPRGP